MNYFDAGDDFWPQIAVWGVGPLVGRKAREGASGEYLGVAVSVGLCN